MTSKKINFQDWFAVKPSDPVTALREDFFRHLRYTLAASNQSQTDQEKYLSFALAVRDRLMDRWIKTQDAARRAGIRRVYYLSMEFLIGRLLDNNAINLHIADICQQVLQEQNISWEELKELEADPGLGNGGLGRLAACFMDSMATLGLPCQGYGLRYDYGIFRQKIVNGQQVEEPDAWRREGYPWEHKRPAHTATIGFGGVSTPTENNGRTIWRWVPAEHVAGVPYDIAVVGYGGQTVNTLRLWSARASVEFDFQTFNQGGYMEAVGKKVTAETLTKALYPNDSFDQGRELRLRQQYFFVACTLADILRRFESEHQDIYTLPDKVFIQLNDTHPTLVIPELMRLLVDIKNLNWEDAWAITRACTGYTNHTIMPEALESWRIEMFKGLLPRHTQIIYEINSRFLREVSKRFPNDHERIKRMSIISDAHPQTFRMANLAVVGSKAVNGVAEIHTGILKNGLFRDFHELWPDKIQNMTNGITQRRWLLQANPGLARLISEHIGTGWVTSLDELQQLKPLADDQGFLTAFRQIKDQNKRNLANFIQRTQHLSIDPESLFDVQIKRLHEYKRQLLLLLYIIIMYRRLVCNPDLTVQPRTFIYAAKAASGYQIAKLIIQLIFGVAKVVNNDPASKKFLRVVFLPDYRVSLAEKIIPAANLSEQISLAGKEASGTGNMKLMLNGALTIGTLDGANVEIREEVGPENFFLFGMTADEVRARRDSYSPWDIYHSDAEIQDAIDCIRDNLFCPLAPDTFLPIVRSLLEYGDHFMVLADLRSYIDTQEQVAQLYQQPQEWNRKAVLNTASAGKFSSDRTIREYASQIWNLQPFTVDDIPPAPPA
jgi:starch phosphorylase